MQLVSKPAAAIFVNLLSLESKGSVVTYVLRVSLASTKWVSANYSIWNFRKIASFYVIPTKSGFLFAESPRRSGVEGL